MSFPYKAIFLDLDGTLLNSKKEISCRNYDCIQKCIEKGLHIIISTGRTIKSARKVTSQLNLTTPVITLNGSDIRSHMEGHSLSITYLDNHTRDSIYEFCRLAKNEFHIKNILADTGNSFLVLNPHSIDVEEFTNHYDEKPGLLDLNVPLSEQIVSYLFLLSDDSNRTDFILNQKKILPPHSKICTFNGWPWIEIGSPTSNKGTALEYVCNYLGISSKETIAFGDGENDVEMLQKAGIGVAMANADIHALKAAEAKTLSHDEDGVAVFLENLMRLHSI